MNELMYFEIEADDLARARPFYGSVFGWSFESQPAAVEYLRIASEGIAGGMLARAAVKAPPHSTTNAFTVSLTVGEFDTTARLILDARGGRRSAEVRHPLALLTGLPH